ncbi:MAG TPA: redox-sensing transcriptional repressor Rex [Actinomycetota bacterium]
MRYGRGARPVVRERAVPEATVGRLPLYLRALAEMVDTDGPVSSDALANAAGVTPAKVRKDLSYLGSYGTRGRGYDAAYLTHQIRRELGLTQHWPILIAGIGNLGHALANYKGFGERGFRVVGLVDVDDAKVGERVAGMAIRPLADLASLVHDEHIAIGVIATPAAAAQEVADLMVEAGLRSILNFAPAVVGVPEGVTVRKVDLAIELQILAYYEQRSAAAPRMVAGGPASARS